MHPTYAPYDLGSFVPFCGKEGVRPYSLLHEDRPLSLPPELIRALEYLLWYVPNINSYQSQENSLIGKALYDDFTFDLLREVMELSTDDVLFCDEIPAHLFHAYWDRVDPRCQKLLLTRGEKETKTEALLRHTRNALAHGFFNVVDDMLIGFDFKGPGEVSASLCTAIVRLRPALLLKALETIDAEVTAERLAAIAFRRAGYCIVATQAEDPSLPYDFSMEKNGRAFAVEIRKFQTPDALTPEDLAPILEGFAHLEDVGLVLLMDSGLLDKDCKALLKEHRITILDIKDIDALLHGQDILASIEKHVDLGVPAKTSRKRPHEEDAPHFIKKKPRHHKRH